MFSNICRVINSRVSKPKLMDTIVNVVAGAGTVFLCRDFINDRMIVSCAGRGNAGGQQPYRGGRGRAARAPRGGQGRGAAAAGGQQPQGQGVAQANQPQAGQGGAVAGHQGQRGAAGGQGGGAAAGGQQPQGGCGAVGQQARQNWVWPMQIPQGGGHGQAVGGQQPQGGHGAAVGIQAQAGGAAPAQPPQGTGQDPNAIPSGGPAAAHSSGTQQQQLAVPTNVAQQNLPAGNSAQPQPLVQQRVALALSQMNIDPNAIASTSAGAPPPGPSTSNFSNPPEAAPENIPPPPQQTLLLPLRESVDIAPGSNQEVHNFQYSHCAEAVQITLTALNTAENEILAISPADWKEKSIKMFGEDYKSVKMHHVIVCHCQDLITDLEKYLGRGRDFSVGADHPNWLWTNQHHEVLTFIWDDAVQAHRVHTFKGYVVIDCALDANDKVQIPVVPKGIVFFNYKKLPIAEPKGNPVVLGLVQQWNEELEKTVSNAVYTYPA